MSLQSGKAALYLEMPDVIPRTEMSAETHWKLVTQVTGIQVGSKSDIQTMTKAKRAFMEAWDYAMLWNVLSHFPYFQAKRTYMGHAVYAEDGVDFNANKFTAFAEPEEVYAFDFYETYGEIDKKLALERFDEHYTNTCAAYPDTLNMTGIYVTAISGFLDMLGWDMLLYSAGYDYAAYCDFCNRYSRWITPLFEAMAVSKSPVVMIHDDMVWTSGPFIRLAFYKEVLFPNIKRQLAPVVEAGKKILFTSDGNYDLFVDDIADCGVTGFCLEPLTNMEAIAEKYGKTHTIIGNADTRILLTGTKEDIYREVKRCIDTGRNCPGFMMCVGNHIPPNTPIENALYYNECYEKQKKR